MNIATRYKKAEEKKAKYAKPPAKEIMEHRQKEIEKEVAESAPLHILIQKHKKTLAYQAEYQRDLRTIKRLGLSMTVKQYRQSKESEK